jgi:long-subunit fatty acid transport protein
MEYIMNSTLSIWAGLKYYNPSSTKKYLYPGTSEIDQWTGTVGAAYDISGAIEMNLSGLYNYGSEEYDSQKYKAEHFFITTGLRIRYK